MCDVDLENIGLEKGEVKDTSKVQFSDEKWVAYNYRSKYADDSVPYLYNNEHSLEVNKTMTFYVVSSKYLKEFFEKMIQIDVIKEEW